MSFEVSHFSDNEAQEILSEVEQILSYALSQGKKSRTMSSAVLQRIERGGLAVRTGLLSDVSTSTIMTQGSIAHKCVRDARHLIGNTTEVGTVRHRINGALMRSLDLLVPFTQKRGPYLLYLRRRPIASRRNPPALYGNRRTKLLDIDIPGDFGSQFFTGFDERNIDTGGLFIATFDIKPLGTQLAVRVRLPNEEIVVGDATVEWIREFTDFTQEVSPGMGIVFHDLSRQAQKEINRHLKKSESIFFVAS